VLGPALYHLISIPGIFALTGVLALAAIGVVKGVVPDPGVSRFHSDAEAVPARLGDVVRDPQLARLNFGIFALHAVQMAMFVVLPFALRETGGIDANHHWQVYLPVMAVSFVAMVPAIVYGERRARLKEVLIGAVALMLGAQLVFAGAMDSFRGIVTGLCIYFIAFNILEASLPSVISKLAPARSKGTAIGVYNTSQSLGLFVGGALGGVLSKYYGAGSVFVFGTVLIGVWLVLAFGMQRLPAVKTMMFHLPDLDADDARRLERSLAAVSGVTEAAVLADEGVAYLKVDRHRLDEQSLRRLLPETA